MLSRMPGKTKPSGPMKAWQINALTSSGYIAVPIACMCVSPSLSYTFTNLTDLVVYGSPVFALGAAKLQLAWEDLMKLEKAIKPAAAAWQQGQAFEVDPALLPLLSSLDKHGNELVGCTLFCLFAQCQNSLLGCPCQGYPFDRPRLHCSRCPTVSLLRPFVTLCHEQRLTNGRLALIPVSRPPFSTFRALPFTFACCTVSSTPTSTTRSALPQLQQRNAIAAPDSHIFAIPSRSAPVVHTLSHC